MFETKIYRHGRTTPHIVRKTDYAVEAYSDIFNSFFLCPGDHVEIFENGRCILAFDVTKQTPNFYETV